MTEPDEVLPWSAVGLEATMTGEVRDADGNLIEPEDEE